MIENKILTKKYFPAKITSGEALFPLLVKAKNATNANNQQFWTFFFTFFTLLTLIVLKNNKSLEQLNVLLRIFFVSGVFQNVEVDFWPLLTAEILFIFYHPYESYKLIASRIPFIVTALLSIFLELITTLEKRWFKILFIHLLLLYLYIKLSIY